MRDRYKVVCLALQYGMAERTLARNLKVTIPEAREMIRQHRNNFRTFWAWLEGAVDHAALSKSIETVFGWRMLVTDKTKRGTLLNYPMQSNGAEMMRLAAIYGIEAGIEICCPIHDAFLICAPSSEIEEAVAKMQDIMARASRVVLGDLSLRSDAKVYHYPDRYVPEGGEAMWDRVQRLVH